MKNPVACHKASFAMTLARSSVVDNCAATDLATATQPTLQQQN